MTEVLRELPHQAAVAIIRLRSLGDCVLTTPALRLLRQFRRDLRIYVAVEERFAPVFAGNGDVQVIPPTLGAVRNVRPELCLNLHGGSRSVILTAGSGARWRAGFQHHRWSGLYNVPIPTAQEILGTPRKVHTAEHLASAMFYLGVPRTEVPRACLFARRELTGHPYAVLHPVAATVSKTWPAERFIALAHHLNSEHGLKPVFIAAPGEDLTEFSEFRTVQGASLEHVKSLLARATLFVGNDSGPAHMAAAFGVPVVVLFGASDPQVWAPWRVESEVLTGQYGMASIDVASVVRAVDRVRVAR